MEFKKETAHKLIGHTFKTRDGRKVELVNVFSDNGSSPLFFFDREKGVGFTVSLNGKHGRMGFGTDGAESDNDIDMDNAKDVVRNYIKGVNRVKSKQYKTASVGAIKG